MRDDKELRVIHGMLTITSGSSDFINAVNMTATISASDSLLVLLCELPKIHLLEAAWLDRLLPFIDVSEKTRIMKMARPVDQLRSTIGQMMLHVIATRLLHGDAFQIRRAPKGRPFLSCADLGHGTLDVNLSHQGPYVFCAGTLNKCVGVDIMDADSLAFLSESAGLDSLAGFLHQREIAYCRGFASVATLTCAVSLFWVLKEAFAKALGTGIDGRVKTWDVSLLVSRLLEMPKCCVLRVQGSDWVAHVYMTDSYTWCINHFPAGAEPASFPGEEHVILQTSQGVILLDLDMLYAAYQLEDTTAISHLNI